MLLGDVIYNYRAQHKMTLKDFAARSGLSVSYVNQLEKNRNPKTNEAIVPSLETFSKVAKAMGITLDHLLSIVDENQPVGLQQSAGIPGTRPALSTDEQALLDKYRILNPTGKERLMEQADLLASSPAFTDSGSQQQVG